MGAFLSAACTFEDSVLCASEMKTYSQERMIVVHI